MTKQDDIRLPEGYEDWVEVSVEPDGEFVKEEVIHWSARYGTGGRSGMPVQKVRYFVPPKSKPKPVLPDVKPGAVLRYTDMSGQACRAIKLDRMCKDPWQVLTDRGNRIESVSLNDDELLDDVNADGFTVELDGL